MKTIRLYINVLSSEMSTITKKEVPELMNSIKSSSYLSTHNPFASSSNAVNTDTSSVNNTVQNTLSSPSDTSRDE